MTNRKCNWKTKLQLQKRFEDTKGKIRRTGKVMAKKEKEKNKELQHCIENLIEQHDLR